MKKRSNIIQLLFKIGLAIIGIFAASALVGAFDNPYYYTILNTSMFYFITVSGIMLMLGYGGFMGFSSIAFMGLGAYLCAYFAMNFGMPTIVAVIVAAATVGLVTMGIGVVLLRLNGSFFMFATMGLTFMATSFFVNCVPFTGGANGIYGIPKLSLFSHQVTEYSEWFTILLVLSLLVVFLMTQIKKTSLGRSLMACRDDEIAAYSFGVNVLRTKLIAFTIGGVLAGFSGALYALHNGVISSTLFSYNVQVKFLIMVMLGGVQSVWGTFLGAILITLLPEILKFATRYINIIYGVIIVLLMIFMPTGLAGLFGELKNGVVRKYRRMKGGERGDIA